MGKVKRTRKEYYDSVVALRLSKGTLINCLGDIVPKGFAKTTATVPQLKKLKVDTVKGLIAIDRYMDNYQLITRNLIKSEDLEKVTDYLDTKKMSKKAGYKFYQKDVAAFLAESEK